MKERPILFSAPMVQAILSGRKTQTRRILKGSTEHKGPYNPAYLEAHKKSPGWSEICPYGRPGDRLWVRETHGFGKHAGEIVYKADGGWANIPGFQVVACDKGKWRPSIHMKRAHSRILLEIVAVRVERLHDISEEDALAEGMGKITKDGALFKYGIPDRDGYPGNDDSGWPWDQWEVKASKAFQKLWKSINGEKSWDENPWVWVVEFKRIEHEKEAAPQEPDRERPSIAEV